MGSDATFATPGTPQERTYVCTDPGCDRSFVRSEHLSRHRLNHRPCKVFTCSRCPKRFVRLDLYKRHKARHDKGMHFRNTGGVVHGDIQPNTMLEEITQPGQPAVSVSLEEHAHSVVLSRGSSAASTPPINRQEHEHYASALNYNRSLIPIQTSQVNGTGPGFTYGSPPGDPETIFFDDSANIWDLPDNLEWFFEASEQDAIAAITDADLSFAPPPFLSSGSPLLSCNEPLGLTFNIAVTESCWFTVQSRLLQSLSSLHPDPQSHFFHPSNLAICYNLYFENYHPHFPIIHRPTLFVTEAEPLLIAAIITLGSTLASDDMIYSIGQKVHSSLRWIIFQTGKFEPPCPLWCLQALLLVQAQAKMSSTRKNYEMADIFHGAILTMMKRGKAYSPSLEPARNQHTTLELSWLQWAEQESSRRTAFFAFIMDAQHSSVFGHTPVLSVSDVRLPLPCVESLWECPTATLWHEQSQSIPKPPQFLPTLKAILGKSLSPHPCSDYSRLILLHGFLSLITHLHARECTTLGIGSGKAHSKDQSAPLTQMDDWVEVISRAMGIWSFSLLSLEASLCLEAARPLYRMAYITLHANIVDIHTLAKDQALLDNLLSKNERSKAEARLKIWSKREEAKRAVRHSLLLVKETVLNGKRYRAREDNIAARPWCLFNAVLVLWGYGQTVETCEIEEAGDTVTGAEEYIARMLIALESKGSSAAYAKRTRGLILSMRHAFEGCRWELLDEAYQTLGRLSAAMY